MSRMPRAPKFRHFCQPCDKCGGEDPTCDTCLGESTPCECETAWYDECERRYDAWKDGD